jgi:hypothetical protein
VARIVHQAYEGLLRFKRMLVVLPNWATMVRLNDRGVPSPNSILESA